MVKALRALPGEQRRIELKPWLYRIAHNESIELLRRRREGSELGAELAAPGPGLADEAVTRERLRQLLSDLDALPDRQRGALVMRELAGLDYEQIGTALGTSAGVARQTLYEARLSLREMDEGREMRCDSVTRTLSDGDGRVVRRRDVRAHLRTCADCRRFREEIATRKHDLAAISPLPAAVAAGLLKGLVGAQAGGSVGAAGALGGGAAKTVGASAVLKGAATVAVVAAIGVGAADRGGLVHLGPSDRHDGQAPTQPAAGSSLEAAEQRAAGAPRRLGMGAPVRTKAAAKVKGARAAVSAPSAKSSVPSDETAAAAAPDNGSGDKRGAHPSGKGHEKQLPAASTHGQGTAAAHKGGGRGASQAKGNSTHPAHPQHPSHPSHPTAPATEKTTPAAPPANGGGEPRSNGSAAPEQTAPATAPQQAHGKSG